MARRMLVLLSVVLFSLSVRAQTEEPQKAGLKIDEMKLGTAVENRAIAGETAEFSVGQKAYVWMKVTGGAGDSISVTWEYGEKSYTTVLAIAGSPWRTWAYKTLYGAGDWKVKVTDSAGSVLKELDFKVREAGKM
jgi:hypothetical protein